MNSKEKVLNVLKNIQIEEPQAIMSLRSISYEAKVSLNYTNRIIDDFIIDKQVQKIQKNYRMYYRMIPPPAV